MTRDEERYAAIVRLLALPDRTDLLSLKGTPRHPDPASDRAAACSGSRCRRCVTYAVPRSRLMTALGGDISAIVSLRRRAVLRIVPGVQKVSAG